MAPRAPESFEDFCLRVQQALAAGRTEVRFGRHHASHALCVEGDIYRIRRLEVTSEEAEAFTLKHGYFMPENAEAIARARTQIYESPVLDKVLKKAGPYL